MNELKRLVKNNLVKSVTRTTLLTGVNNKKYVLSQLSVTRVTLLTGVNNKRYDYVAAEPRKERKKNLGRK